MLARWGLLLLVTLLACAPLDQRVEGSTEPRYWSPDVEVYGQLRDIMHQGLIGERVRLDQLLPDPQLYALGAMAGLDGEITILGGEAWISRPGPRGRVDTRRSELSPDGATLLVASRVPAWQEFVVERYIRWGELDDAIEEYARAAGLSPGDRFPFVLQGEMRSLDWHVVDGSKLGEGASSHAEHMAAGIQLSRLRVEATLLGFYSARDAGVFTHMGSRTHIHATIEDPYSSGHVDQVEIPAGTILRLPLVERGR